MLSVESNDDSIQSNKFPQDQRKWIKLKTLTEDPKKFNTQNKVTFTTIDKKAKVCKHMDSVVIDEL